MSPEVASYITAASGAVVAIVVGGGALFGLVKKPFSNLRNEIRDDLRGVRNDIGRLGDKIDNLDSRLSAMEQEQRVVVGVLKTFAPSPISDAIGNIIPMTRVDSK